MTDTVYRINKWNEVFERAESRKLKNLNWIAWPISFGSNGYQSLLDDFGDDAPAIYGAWCALCSRAATCCVRGLLATSRGIPLRLSHIARETGFPVELFERLVRWATSDEIQWLVTVSEVELAQLLHPGDADRDSATNEIVDTGPRDGGQANTPGESPDVPPDRRGKTHATRPDLTLPNKTQPNITQPDQTALHRTGHHPVGAIPDSARQLGDRWSAMTMDRGNWIGFFEVVTELANRFMRLRGPILNELDREIIWQMAWIGSEFDRGVVDDIRDRLATGEIKKPRQYAESCMRNLCTKLGHDWRVLKALVPIPKPTSQPTPQPTRPDPVNEESREEAAA